MYASAGSFLILAKITHSSQYNYEHHSKSLHCCVFSYKVVRFLHGDSVLGKGRCQVFHGEGISAILPLTRLARLRGSPRLTVLQSIVSNV